MSLPSIIPFNSSLLTTQSGFANLSSTTIQPSPIDQVAQEIKDYFIQHKEQVPLLITVYLLCIIWIIYLILYHSRIQGILLSYLIRRLYFKDSADVKFDSFSISFISGKIMFRNLHYSTTTAMLHVKDGYLIFRYWSRQSKTERPGKPKVRLIVYLKNLDLQFFNPVTKTNDQLAQEREQQKRNGGSGSVNGCSVKGDDAQNESSSNFTKRLRSLFPAIKIKISNGRLCAGHESLPYGFVIRFQLLRSTLTTLTPCKSSLYDLFTVLYECKYHQLKIHLFPIKRYKGTGIIEVPPSLVVGKHGDRDLFEIFQCNKGELEYEQDVPGKVVEQSLVFGTDGVLIPVPDPLWEIRLKCNDKAQISYSPWADRQRELLWAYFLPTLYEESLPNAQPQIGQNRIFKNVRFLMYFNQPSKLDLYFNEKSKLHNLHVDFIKGSKFECLFPWVTLEHGFDSFINISILQPQAKTNLAFQPLLQAEKVDINLVIHYPRLWNSLQDWKINIDAQKAKVHFIFEHKNYFVALLNDLSSNLPPQINKFTPFVYNILVKGSLIEVLVPCNQCNWIDCDLDQAENNLLSICAKSLDLTFCLPFTEYCPKSTPMDLNIEVNDILARLVIPEGNRSHYILKGLKSHQKFHTPNGIKNELKLVSELVSEFETNDSCFNCGETSAVKIKIQFLLHSSSPVDVNRTDLLYVQWLKSIGNRQTFHPAKLDYDVFDIEIEIAPLTLLLYGIFLKRLWWVKENLFGWDQMFHDIKEPKALKQLAKSNPIKSVNNDVTKATTLVVENIDDHTDFDSRYYRPLAVTVRVSIHNIIAHIVQYTDNEPCPIAFCERLCFEMTTDLDETRLQLYFPPVHLYLEDTVERNKSDSHLSTGCITLSGLIIRGHAMLSHEGLPPERETLEYSWQMDILLGKISTQLTMIQLEKLLTFGQNFFLLIMEDEYELVRSPIGDKTSWIEKQKYDILRFSLDSLDFNLVEVGNALNLQLSPVRLCKCNLHSSTCSEGLTLKIGSLQLRQLLRLHPRSWLEAGSFQVSEIRINGKLGSHLHLTSEQIDFLKRHDQRTHRLHFLWNKQQTQQQQKRLSTAGLTSVSQTQQHGGGGPTCACLGGSPAYYTLANENFFKSTYLLSQQTNFGKSLFRPDVHLFQSHPIFETKYEWMTYDYRQNQQTQSDDDTTSLNNYPFDFCDPTLLLLTNSAHASHHAFRHSVPNNLFMNNSSSLSRTNSARTPRVSTVNIPKQHKRSSSSIIEQQNLQQGTSGSSSSTTNDVYLTPSENLSSNNSSRTSLNSTLKLNQMLDDNSSISSSSSAIPSTVIQHTTTTDGDTQSTMTSPSQSYTNLLKQLNNNSQQDPAVLSRTSSSDSLNMYEEILQKQQQQSTGNLNSLDIHRQGSSLEVQHDASWISLRNQMKMPIQNSTLLCTSYIRYLSHYRSKTSHIQMPPVKSPPTSDPLLEFDCVSQGFSCSFLIESPTSSTATPTSTTTSKQQQQAQRPPTRTSTITSTTNDICIKCIGSINILLTPLILECLTTYIEKWKQYEIHPLSVLDRLHFEAQQKQSLPASSLSNGDTVKTKISLQLPKINLCLLQAGLAEDNVQLTELITPVDIVTMSLFSLSLKQIQIQTILSSPDESAAIVFKIQSLTGQFRRFENDFSSLDNVNVHAIQSQRCKLQLRISQDQQTHLPVHTPTTLSFGNGGSQQRKSLTSKNFGYVMNEFGIQKLCFKLVNNSTKGHQRKKTMEKRPPTVTAVDETATTKEKIHTKAKRKQSTEVLLLSSPIPTPLLSPNYSVKSLTTSTNSSSSSVFDGSIDHIWISFPEPPHSSGVKAHRKKLFSYTRYDWNFLSTLSPTVLGWFCVINRVKKPLEELLFLRQQRIDSILAYYLIETQPDAIKSLKHSKLYDLFTPKTKCLLTNPVGQLVCELRRRFGELPKEEYEQNLDSKHLPDIQLLKRGIKEACRAWVHLLKRQHTTSTSTTNNSSTDGDTKDTPPTRTVTIEQQAKHRSPTIDRLKQKIIGHEYAYAHTRQSVYPGKKDLESGSTNDETVRQRRMTMPSSQSDTTKSATVFTRQPHRSSTAGSGQDCTIVNMFEMTPIQDTDLMTESQDETTNLNIGIERRDSTNSQQKRKTTNFLAPTTTRTRTSSQGHVNVAYAISNGDMVRTFAPVVNVDNANGYKRLSGEESDFETTANSPASSQMPKENPFQQDNEPAVFDDAVELGELTEDLDDDDIPYYTDAGPEYSGPVEQLFKVLLEYAGVEMSVSSSIEPLFEKLGQTILASVLLKCFDVKILPNEPLGVLTTTGQAPSMTTTTSVPVFNTHQSTINTGVHYRPPFHRPSTLAQSTSELSVLSVNSLSIQSVCRQLLEHDQLHSANVQAGIRVQRVQQEVNLPLLRLIYQFYTVVGNALEYESDEIEQQTQPDQTRQNTRSNTLVLAEQDQPLPGSRLSALENLIIKPVLGSPPTTDVGERLCWKKLRELVYIYAGVPDVKQVTVPPLNTRQQQPTKQRSGSQPPEPSTVLQSNDLTTTGIPSSPILTNNQNNSSFKLVHNTRLGGETILLSSFGWLVIDEIHYAATLGGLKVEGCMRKAQGSITLTQRLRGQTLVSITGNTKKYDGSLIVQIGSTSLSLKETLTSALDSGNVTLSSSMSTTQSTFHPASGSSSFPSKQHHHPRFHSPLHHHHHHTHQSTTQTHSPQTSVLDIVVGKSQALTSLQTRGIHLTLSGVTNIGSITMDVPLRPQDVHDLVNRTSRLIASSVMEFLPDDPNAVKPTTTTTTGDSTTAGASDLPDGEPLTPTPVQIKPRKEKKRMSTVSQRRRRSGDNHRQRRLKSQQSTANSLTSKKPIFEAHITAHFQGMTFSTTLLPTLKAQYKIGIIEGVANIGLISKFSAIMREHALHFLNTSTQDEYSSLSSNSDNHVRIDFPVIRINGEYLVKNEQELQENQPLTNNKTNGHLNLKTRVELLNLTITADFLAQLVFVSKVIIREINEILAKVSGIEHFHFLPAKQQPPTTIKTAPIMKISSSGSESSTEEEEDDDEEETTDATTGQQGGAKVVPFTYKIDLLMRGFEVTGMTPSNTVVKFENGQKSAILVKMTNYDDVHSILLYKPLINASLDIKLSLGQLLHTGGFQDAAYFKTKVLLKKSFRPDNQDKEAFFLRLTKPSFYWQPGAIDKAILFWLNYKNTYEHWNEQRGQFANENSHLRQIVTVTPDQLNLMFQLNIVDLGIAIPLQYVTPLDSATQQSLDSSSTSADSGDFLVFTLEKTTISACSCGAIISSGSFEGFCFRFAENFKQTNSDWIPVRKEKVIMNACCVPSGQYVMYSRAKQIRPGSSPKWFLNVEWDMKGIDINLDSIIGKRFSQLITTITSTHLMEPVVTDDSGSLINGGDDLNLSNGSHTVGNGSSGNIESQDEDEKAKKQRLEYEQVVLGQKIDMLKKANAPFDQIQPEMARFKRLEQELMQNIRREIQQKMKKQSTKPQTQILSSQQQEILRRTSGVSPSSDQIMTVINRDRRNASDHKRAQSHDYTSNLRNVRHIKSNSFGYSDASIYLNHNNGEFISGTSSSDKDLLPFHSYSHPSPIREDDNEDNSNTPKPPLLNRNNPFEETYYSIPQSFDIDGSQQLHSSSNNNLNNNVGIGEITTAPAVDLELNVQVQIASGSCNLFTRRDLLQNSQNNKLLPSGSHSINTSATSKQQPSTQYTGLSVVVNKIEYQVSEFSLPGVLVDAHYVSKHDSANDTNELSSKHQTSVTKRANFYCRATIQSPVTIITIHPLLLDFVEQMLEHVNLPEPSKIKHQTLANGQQQTDDQASDSHLNAMFLIEDQPTSFPIDVVVSIFIQPSILLFTCLPSHPMECELKLPAVDVVFSSKRANIEIEQSRMATDDDEKNIQVIENSIGGISFSLFMKDFKLNIYHPFSGESKVQLFEDIKSGQLQTRNALSVSVQSVSFNISRTRRTIIEQQQEPVNSVKLSVIGLISRAQFEYDIRRFSEILTFPKIWYNRSLARRLFLGDENISTQERKSTRANSTVKPDVPTKSSKSGDATSSGMRTGGGDSSAYPSRSQASPNQTTPMGSNISTTPTATTANIHKWKTRVLLAINLKELHISMRMSNVMGKVEWKTTDVCSTGSLSLTSQGHRSLFFSIGLQNSNFQAEQGIVGGIIRLKNLQTTGLIRQGVRDKMLIESSHVFDVTTDAIECRLDYMGSPTLMARICYIILRLKDDRHASTTTTAVTPSTLVFLNLEWSQVHLMITRSTTPDIIKMAHKLKEFFKSQIANSKTLLTSIQMDFRDQQPSATAPNKRVKEKGTAEVPPTIKKEKKYDHNVVKRIIGMNGGEIMLQGYNLTLVVFHGLNFKCRQWALFSLNEPQIIFVTDKTDNNEISQKLFFYLGHQDGKMQTGLKPRTNMASISKVTRGANEAPSHLTINEWFNYANSTIPAIGLRPFPTMDPEPQNGRPQGLNKHLEQHPETIFVLPGLELRFQTKQHNGKVHCSFETDFYEHIMFSFNAEHFYFLHDLISSYMKEKERALVQALNDNKPQNPSVKDTPPPPPPPPVTSPATTVTYTSNQQTVQMQIPTSQATNVMITKTDTDKIKSDELSNDLRKFTCPDSKWKLEPTIRLLTAYGNEVEPFGADYILQRLGFRHARLTIPKWLQRGIMDPCEQSMTVVMLLLIFLLPERFKEMCMNSPPPNTHTKKD